MWVCSHVYISIGGVDITMKYLEDKDLKNLLDEIKRSRQAVQDMGETLMKIKELWKDVPMMITYEEYHTILKKLLKEIP